MTMDSDNPLFANVASAAEGVVQATSGAEFPRNLDFLLDVSLQVSVEVGRTRMTIQDLLQLGQGSVIELTKLAGEPLDVYINERLVARGEAVIVNEKFGVRITDIISQQERVEGLG
jgi:flagellar motor switch protein FliN